jgi:hypothetical protein
MARLALVDGIVTPDETRGRRNPSPAVFPPDAGDGKNRREKDEIVEVDGFFLGSC